MKISSSPKQIKTLGTGSSGSGGTKEKPVENPKPPTEHISEFQEDEDAMHESQHELVQDDKKKSPKKGASPPKDPKVIQTI
jgi:hypothetical protein